MFPDAMREVSEMVVDFIGGGATSTLRRSNTIQTASLTLAGAALVGVSSLTADSPGLEGFARKGAVFTVAGVSGTYVLGSDAEASGGAIVLAFAPVLAGPAADGAVLTFTVDYAESVFPRMVGAQIQKDEDAISQGDLVKWLAYVPGHPAPAQGDKLDGLMVKSVQPIGEGPSRWKVTTEAAH